MASSTFVMWKISKNQQRERTRCWFSFKKFSKKSLYNLILSINLFSQSSSLLTASKSKLKDFPDFEIAHFHKSNNCTKNQAKEYYHARQLKCHQHTFQQRLMVLCHKHDYIRKDFCQRQGFSPFSINQPVENYRLIQFSFY